MRRVLTARVMPAIWGVRLAWIAAFLLLSFCTTLVLTFLPELDLARSTVLVGGLALAWLVIAAQTKHLR